MGFGVCGTLDSGLCSIFLTLGAQRPAATRTWVALSEDTRAKQWRKHYPEMAAWELGALSLQDLFDTAMVVRDRRNPVQDRHLLFLKPVDALAARWTDDVFKPSRWLKAAVKVVVSAARPPEVFLVSLHTVDDVAPFLCDSQPIREAVRTRSSRLDSLAAYTQR